MIGLPPEVVEVELHPGGKVPPALVRRARRLLDHPEGRAVLGIVGAPGAGKSTLAAMLVKQLVREAGPVVALVPMDGFHLANSALERLGRRDRKGAPDTFDAAGYVALLHRLRAADQDVVHAPEFRREIEEAVAGAIGIGPDVRLVITEGNYLLLDEGPWANVRELLTEAWFLEADDVERRRRLVHRHVRFGKSLEVATAWVDGPDENNARLIAETAQRADVVVRLTGARAGGRLVP